MNEQQRKKFDRLLKRRSILGGLFGFFSGDHWRSPEHINDKIVNVIRRCYDDAMETKKETRNERKKSRM